MKNSQIAQLQELNRCYLLPDDRKFVNVYMRYPNLPYNKYDKATIRRLTHQYRHQVAVMKRNRAQGVA